MPLHLRRFEPADQEVARSLILEGLAEHWGSIDERLNPDLDDIATTFQNGAFWVALLEGRLVGTGGWLWRSPHRAEIVRMSVAASCRRAGVGRVILEQLVDDACAHGATSLFLETNEAWREVIVFYTKCAFRPGRREPSEFGPIVWFHRDCERSSAAIVGLSL